MQGGKGKKRGKMGVVRRSRAGQDRPPLQGERNPISYSINIPKKTHPASGSFPARYAGCIFVFKPSQALEYG